MKRIFFGVVISLVAILVAILLVGKAHAGFNFGSDTYATVGNQLIVNSMGDQTTSSTIPLNNQGGLPNDFISENAVSNQLLLDGYTQAWASNNPTALAQCYSQYNQTLPTGVALTQLQFYGLNGNPRAVENFYVLTSQYNTLSAQGQANSIDNLNTGLSNEIVNRIALGNTLTNSINLETSRAIGVEGNLQNSITSETNRAITSEGVLSTGLSTETANRIIMGNVLSNAIGTETVRAEGVENTLNSNINTVDSNSIARDNQLAQGINNEAVTRANADTNLQNNINSVNSRVDNVEHRVNKLYGTQYTIETDARILDTKRVTILPYLKYNFTINNNEVGVRVVVKIGKSYEEKLIDRQEARLSALEGRPQKTTLITRTVDTKGYIKSMQIQDGGVLSINRPF